MTRDDALKLIPPGWVGCDVHKYGGSPGKRWKIELDGWFVCAIPAPEPEPRRVPCGEMVVEFDEHGWPHPRGFWTGPAGPSFENTKWKFDFDTREWVEVLDES